MAEQKMDPTIKARWVAALRSGEYKQGTGQLRDEDNRFCCLGVLCNIHAKAHPRVANRERDPLEYLGHSFLPDDAVMKWAGLNVDCNVQIAISGTVDFLYGHNDTGRTFAEIADAIEAQL